MSKLRQCHPLPLDNDDCSVIQGSLGSCLLYAIYTADLPATIHEGHDHGTEGERDCKNGKIVTFVDDTNNIIKSNRLEDIQKMAQENITEIELCIW